MFFTVANLFASDYDFSDDGEWGDEAEIQGNTTDYDFSDLSTSFIDELDFFGSSADSEEGLATFADPNEPIESSAVDIVLPNANQAVITQLNKGMEGLSAPQRLDYVRGHADEYNNNGAVTVYAGENIGEVVVNNSINSDALVQYQPLGKPELGHQTTLQGALLELTKYPENANIKENTLPVLTYKLQDGNTMITVQKIVPGVLATCAHGPKTEPDQTINLGYVSIGEKEDPVYVDKQFSVERVETAAVDKHRENDARLIILKTPDVLADYVNSPIPVLPIENNPPKKGDTTRMFLRRNEDNFGIKYPERFSEAQVSVDFDGISDGVYSDHWTDHQVMSGHSGTFEYKLDNNGNVNLLGPVRAGFKFANPSPFGMFVNPKVVTELRDKLTNEYQSAVMGGIGLTLSEKEALMKQMNDSASREYNAQFNRELQEKDKEFFKIRPSSHIPLPGDPE
ncbi:MAG: hypothetical protein PHG68_05320 [Candidatus Omnitrophica bacterium]|nr:hypothetical protein [Candidatus Omnitrophota bacterium]